MDFRRRCRFSSLDSAFVSQTEMIFFFKEALTGGVAVDHGNHNFTVIGCFLFFDNDVIAVENTGCDHTVATDLQHKVITAANNLLSAMIDNHLQQGNELSIDPRRILFARVTDTNDRALRNVIVGLGTKMDGVPRQDKFMITVASEIMAILCLAESISDLKERLGNILVAYTYDGKPVYCRELQANGAMAALLKDAIKPNLVQTLENTPALIHGGPFANIAHGCNSVRATKLALKLADYTITEAGFGADLGAEKFLDIKCRKAGLTPDAVVLVATVRALKYNGGVAKTELGTENLDALAKGAVNLEAHIDNLRKYGLPVVVAINRFGSDTDAELAYIEKIIPVVAETYKINDETIVEPKGIDALCLATLDCMDEAKKISEENRNRMILEQKRFSANLLTGTTTTMGVIVGAVPIAFPDSTILVPLEIALTKGILKIYGIETKGDLIAAIVGSTTISEVARATLGAVTKVVPNLASSALNAVVAGFFVTALGESVIALSEAVYLGKIDVEKIDNVVKFVSDKLKENPVFEFVVSFFEEHPELIQGKSAKEIFGLISGAFKNSKKQ